MQSRCGKLFFSFATTYVPCCHTVLFMLAFSRSTSGVCVCHSCVFFGVQCVVYPGMLFGSGLYELNVCFSTLRQRLFTARNCSHLMLANLANVDATVSRHLILLPLKICKLIRPLFSPSLHFLHSLFFPLMAHLITLSFFYSP